MEDRRTCIVDNHRIELDTSVSVLLGNLLASAQKETVTELPGKSQVRPSMKQPEKNTKSMV
jgi:hypothetical protein